MISEDFFQSKLRKHRKTSFLCFCFAIVLPNKFILSVNVKRGVTSKFSLSFYLNEKAQIKPFLKDQKVPTTIFCHLNDITVAKFLIIIINFKRTPKNFHYSVLEYLPLRQIWRFG